MSTLFFVRAQSVELVGSVIDSMPRSEYELVLDMMDVPRRNDVLPGSRQELVAALRDGDEGAARQRWLVRYARGSQDEAAACECARRMGRSDESVWEDDLDLPSESRRISKLWWAQGLLHEASPSAYAEPIVARVTLDVAAAHPDAWFPRTTEDLDYAATFAARVLIDSAEERQRHPLCVTFGEKVWGPIDWAADVILSARVRGVRSQSPAEIRAINVVIGFGDDDVPSELLLIAEWEIVLPRRWLGAIRAGDRWESRAFPDL